MFLYKKFVFIGLFLNQRDLLFFFFLFLIFDFVFLFIIIYLFSYFFITELLREKP